MTVLLAVRDLLANFKLQRRNHNVGTRILDDPSVQKGQNSPQEVQNVSKFSKSRDDEERTKYMLRAYQNTRKKNEPIFPV